MKAIHFMITNKIKFLAINLTEKVKESRTENNKMLMKEMEGDVK